MRFSALPRHLDYPAWPPLLANRGPGSRSEAHAHHAIHLLLAIDGELTCQVKSAQLTAAGVITAPDVPHQIDSHGAEILLVFLDPESAVGAALLPSLGDGARSIDATQREALLHGVSPGLLMGPEGALWVAKAARLLGCAPHPTRSIHPRVRRVLSYLRSAGPDADTSLGALSQLAGLSEGRFMHIFTSSIGIPLRRYLAWRKLQRAAAAIVTGRSATDAAHEAGFSDSAHLTRSFLQMFGMRPSDLQRSLKTAS